MFDAVDASFAGWLSARVTGIISAAGHTLSGDESELLGGAVNGAASTLRTELGALLVTDVDDQRQNPLHVLRAAAVTVNPVLASLSIAKPHRDEFEMRAMPGDEWAIGPLAWNDLGDAVHEAGISWGAWKAATVLTRRRAEGKVQ